MTRASAVGDGVGVGVVGVGVGDDETCQAETVTRGSAVGDGVGVGVVGVGLDNRVAITRMMQFRLSFRARHERSGEVSTISIHATHPRKSNHLDVFSVRLRTRIMEPTASFFLAIHNTSFGPHINDGATFVNSGCG